MKATSRIKLLLIVYLSILCTSAGGQSVSLPDSREFNIAILNTLDLYESVSTLSEQSDSLQFLNLFSDINKPCVYNDCLCSSEFQTMITPLDYVKAYPRDGSVIIRTSLSDIVKVGKIYYDENGLLHRKIACSKYLMLIDTSVYSGGDGGVLFDSSQIYKNDPDFRLIMDFSFSPETKECKICSIAADKEKSRTPLDESGFSIVVKSSDKYDRFLRTRGNKLEFNEFNQSLAYHNDIEMTHPDIVATPVEYGASEHYNVLGFSYRPIFMRAKVYTDFALGGSYKVKTSQDIIKASSGAFEAGIDVGFERSINMKWKMGLYVGAGFSRSTIAMSAPNIEYRINMPYWGIDRRYSFSAKESLTLLDLFVPLYLELEFNLGKKMIFDVDLGAKAYLNMKTKLNPYHVSGRFGDSSVEESFDAFYYPEIYNRGTYDIAPFSRLELDYCLVQRRLYAYVSYGYEMALKPSYESSYNSYLKVEDGIYPFFYSVLSKKDIPSRSLIGTLSYTRRSNLISIGLKLKY